LTKTYDEVLQEIETLKKEAELLRKKETEEAVAAARAIIEKHKLTAEDLGLIRRGKKAKVSSTLKVVKYRSNTNPEDTYGGKGPLPAWLKQKIAEGRTKEEFKVS
jgi:DNA-binding protein H-NS